MIRGACVPSFAHVVPSSSLADACVRCARGRRVDEHPNAEEAWRILNALARAYEHAAERSTNAPTNAATNAAQRRWLCSHGSQQTRGLMAASLLNRHPVRREPNLHQMPRYLQPRRTPPPSRRDGPSPHRGLFVSPRGLGGARGCLGLNLSSRELTTAGNIRVPLSVSAHGPASGARVDTVRDGLFVRMTERPGSPTHGTQSRRESCSSPASASPSPRMRTGGAQRQEGESCAGGTLADNHAAALVLQPRPPSAPTDRRGTIKVRERGGGPPGGWLGSAAPSPKNPRSYALALRAMRFEPAASSALRGDALSALGTPKAGGPGLHALMVGKTVQLVEPQRPQRLSTAKDTSARATIGREPSRAPSYRAPPSSPIHGLSSHG